MRTILFAKVCLLVYSSLASQNLNYADHDRSSSIEGVVRINSKSFYIETAHFCCQTAFISGVSENGSKLFSNKLFPSSLVTLNCISATSDDKVLISGRNYQGCDVASYFIVGFDTLGSKMFEAKGFGPVTAIVPDSDSTFLAFTNKMLRFRNTGTVKETLQPTPLLISAAQLKNGNLILCFPLGNVYALREITLQGLLVSEILTIDPLNKITAGGSNEYFAMSANSIKKFSTNHVQVKSTADIIPQYKLTDFVIRNDSIFATGYDSLTRPYYCVLDADLNVLYQTLSNCKNLIPIGITVSPTNKILVLTNGTRGKPGLTSNFTGVFQTQVTGSINSIPDIGITNITTVSAYFKNSYGTIYESFGDFDVTIKNFGADTVKNFRLNHVCKTALGGMLAPGVCRQFYSKAYSSSVPPGQSIVVNTGVFSTGIVYPDSIKVNSLLKKEYLFTTIPNEQADINPSNDGYTDSTVLYVGLSQIESVNGKFKLFPNPASDLVKIEYYDAPATEINIVMRDIIGRKLYEGKMLSNTKLHVPLKGLSNGAYFFSVYKNETLIHQAKAVKIE